MEEEVDAEWMPGGTYPPQEHSLQRMLSAQAAELNERDNSYCLYRDTCAHLKNAWDKSAIEEDIPGEPAQEQPEDREDPPPEELTHLSELVDMSGSKQEGLELHLLLEC